MKIIISLLIIFTCFTTAAQQIGSKVSFKAVDGKTYTGVVKEIENSRYRIKYDGYEFESWLDGSILTFLNAPPTPPSLPQTNNSQPKNANTVRADFNSFDRNGSGWLSGNELTACNCKNYDTDGNNEITLEEFLAGNGIKSNTKLTEPVEKKIPIVTANKITAATNGKIYFRTISWYSPYGSTLELKWIFLGDNGTVVVNPKNGVNPVNYAAELKNNAANVGKYHIAGKKLNITWGNGKTVSWGLDFRDGDISVMDAGLVTRPKPMPANYKLSGQYAAGAVLPNVASFQTMVFSKDGTFKLNKAGYVSTADVSGTSTSDSKGTYKISGNTLWLNFDNGDVQKSVLYIMEYPDGKRRLIINQSSFAQEN